MSEFDNLFDQAMSEADGIIRDTFGRQAEIVIGSTGRTVRVVFDDEGIVQRIADGQVMNSSPEIFCALADVDGLKKRDAVYIGGVAFYVSEIGRPDGDSVTIKLAHGEPGKTAPDINTWS